jgi:hypothetical protein
MAHCALLRELFACSPPRRNPYRRTKELNLTYPHGYEIEKVGATEPIAK